MGDLPFDLGLSRTIIVVMVQYRMRYLAVAHSNANTGSGKSKMGNSRSSGRTHKRIARSRSVC